MINANQKAILFTLLYAYEKENIDMCKWLVYGGNLIYKTGKNGKYHAFIYNGTNTKNQTEEISLEQFDRYDDDFAARKRNALTDKDRIRIGKLNSKNGYGMSMGAFRSLVKQHKKAMLNEDYHKMACYEYRLTDINFHAECSLMSCGLHEAALLL